MADEFLTCPECEWRIGKDEPMAAAKRGQHRRKEHGVAGRDSARKTQGPADKRPNRAEGQTQAPPSAADFAGKAARKGSTAKKMEQQVLMAGRLIFMWDVVCGATWIRSAESIGEAAEVFGKEFPWFAKGMEESSKLTAIVGLAFALGQPLMVMGAHHGLLPAQLVPAEFLEAEARLRDQEHTQQPPAGYPMPPAPDPFAAPGCTQECQEGHTYRPGCVMFAAADVPTVQDAPPGDATAA